jgi:hypothetical protein
LLVGYIFFPYCHPMILACTGFVFASSGTELVDRYVLNDYRFTRWVGNKLEPLLCCCCPSAPSSRLANEVNSPSRGLSNVVINGHGISGVAQHSAGIPPHDSGVSAHRSDGKRQQPTPANAHTVASTVHVSMSPTRSSVA